MKKIQWAVLALWGVLILGGMTACDLPEYQLSFSITGSTDSGVADTTVYYTIENIGMKDMENASIRIESNGVSAWPTGTNLSVGESDSGSLFIIEGSPGASAEIIAAGWDEGD